MMEPNRLRAVKFFRTFTDRQLKEIADITTERSYAAEALIYKEGQQASEIFVVEKGLVSLRSFKTEDELVLAFELCEAGDIFGAASLLRDQIYTLDAVCLEKSNLFVVDANELSKRCEVDFELGYRLMNEIAQLYLGRYEVAKRDLGIPVITRKGTGTSNRVARR